MITDKFIFVHIPKTGGQFIIHKLIGPQIWNFSKVLVHEPLSTMREMSKENNIDNMPSFCFIRNPWDWYVSRFHFDFKPQMVDKNNDYKKEFIDHMLSIDYFKTNENEEFYKKHKECRTRVISGEILATSTNVKEMITRQFIFSKLTLSDWYNFLVDEKIDYICRFENFRDDLLYLFPKLSEKYNYDLINNTTKQKLNDTYYKHYKHYSYYDNDTIDLVYKWDNDYINKFNYSF